MSVNEGEVSAAAAFNEMLDGSGLKLEERGAHRLQGVDEDWALYAAMA